MTRTRVNPGGSARIRLSSRELVRVERISKQVVANYLRSAMTLNITRALRRPHRQVTGGESTLVSVCEPILVLTERDCEQDPMPLNPAEGFQALSHICSAVRKARIEDDHITLLGMQRHRLRLHSYDGLRLLMGVMLRRR